MMRRLRILENIIRTTNNPISLPAPLLHTILFLAETIKE